MVRFDRIAPVFPVRNVAAALDHYRKLGFDAKAYAEGVDEPAGPIYGFLSWGPVHIHLARVVDLDPLANTSACYIYVDDAAALYRQWTAVGAGGRFEAPQDTEYNLREMAHVDPDGNLLRIGSELPR